MSGEHLTMEQLIAVRDGDRSEAALVEAHRHIAGCDHCRAELDRLHQRTARLRALDRLDPSTDQFPVVMGRLAADRRHRRHRFTAIAGLAAAAALAITVVGHDLVQPPELDASEQLQTAISRSQALEQTLDDYRPDQRVVDGRTMQVIIQLEDRIADVDSRLQHVVHLERDKRLPAEVALWQERVGLMSALVDVHLTKATNVDL
jgi:anti-sigma factor RsiW